MSKRPADHGEREHAVSALDTCLLVEAAAGTGKTTLLVDRILALLRAGRARLPEIAAITFTEKAAGELKIRLREMIERGLREAGSEEGGRLRTALFDLDAMTVCTIHSFCGELIRERPVEAGVEPNFAVADELTASRVFRQAWEEWLAGGGRIDGVSRFPAGVGGVACRADGAGKPRAWTRDRARAQLRGVGVRGFPFDGTGPLAYGAA